MRLVGSLLLVTLVTIGHAAAQSPTIVTAELKSPAGLLSLGASLTTAPDGTVWLSWVEASSDAAAATHDHHHSTSAPTAANTLRCAIFDTAQNAWSKTHMIATASSLTPNSADFPQLAIGGKGTAYAVWTDGHGARVSESHDGGASWGDPRPWTTTGNEVEKFSFVRLADGRVLGAWLDGRARKAGGKAQQLYARIVGEPETSDRLIDASVCDCCQTSLAAFLDGGALVAYRGRTEENIRDIWSARLIGSAWTSPRVLNHDDWRIAACPVNGPRIHSDGSRVAAAWFTAAGNESHVYASFSPDAGARWLMPARIDRGHPTGHVDAVLLRDGAIVVSWLEADGSLWLRRMTPEFSPTEPIVLAPAGAANARAVPRLVLLQDYAGNRTRARLIVAYTGDKAIPGVHTLLVTVPEGELVVAERNCDCAPTLDELEGFPVHGVIAAIDSAHHRVSLQHETVPGVFAPGKRTFGIEGDTSALAVGQSILGRVDRNAKGEWVLENVRGLATQPAK